MAKTQGEMLRLDDPATMAEQGALVDQPLSWTQLSGFYRELEEAKVEADQASEIAREARRTYQMKLTLLRALGPRIAESRRREQSARQALPTSVVQRTQELDEVREAYARLKTQYEQLEEQARSVLNAQPGLPKRAARTLLAALDGNE